MGETDIQSGGEHEVVRFCTEYGRVGDVVVADRPLPAEPAIDFCDEGGIQSEGILAEVAEIGIKGEGFGEVV